MFFGFWTCSYAWKLYIERRGIIECRYIHYIVHASHNQQLYLYNVFQVTHCSLTERDNILENGQFPRFTSPDSIPPNFYYISKSINLQRHKSLLYKFPDINFSNPYSRRFSSPNFTKIPNFINPVLTKINEKRKTLIFWLMMGISIDWWWWWEDWALLYVQPQWWIGWLRKQPNMILNSRRRCVLNSAYMTGQQFVLFI